MKLPDEIIAAIHAFANETAKQKRLFAFAVRDFMDEVPHGKHAEIYEMIADEWNHASGEYVTGRTVRYWVQSVKTYTQAEARQYTTLTSAQLIEAVKLASDCQNTITPQEICDWCIREQVDTVGAMRAEWMQQTGTPLQSDPPALSGIIRLFSRLFKADNPYRKRIDEIITELRSYL